MGMHVHKTRRSHKAYSVDDLRAFRRQIMPHRSNQAPFEQQLARLVPPQAGSITRAPRISFLPIRFLRFFSAATFFARAVQRIVTNIILYYFYLFLATKKLLPPRLFFFLPVIL